MLLVTITRSFQTFNDDTLKQIFWKAKTFFEKLEQLFLVQSLKIKNATFLYNAALSEPNVKIKRMGSTKWTWHKERSFVSNYLVSLRICFSLRTSYKKMIWSINYPNVHIHTFRKHWSFAWGCFFPVSILNWLLLKWNETKHFHRVLFKL